MGFSSLSWWTNGDPTHKKRGNLASPPRVAKVACPYWGMIINPLIGHEKIKNIPMMFGFSFWDGWPDQILPCVRHLIYVRWLLHGVAMYFLLIFTIVQCQCHPHLEAPSQFPFFRGLSHLWVTARLTNQLLSGMILQAVCHSGRRDV
jgi:hypothetical protein